MKPATRPTTRRTASTVFDAGRRRDVIVTVYPSGLIGLRLERRRREEVICADVAYKNAVMDRIASERRAKRKGKS